MLGGCRVELDDGAPPVTRILAPVNEAVCLELGGQLAGRRQRDPDRIGDLAHRLRAGGTDLGQGRDMPSAEARLARHEREQLRGPPPAPEPAHHLSQRATELRELGSAHIGNSCLLLTVIIG